MTKDEFKLAVEDLLNGSEDFEAELEDNRKELAEIGEHDPILAVKLTNVIDSLVSTIAYLRTRNEP